jgi:predicted RNA-binding protein (virulence factor B family)
MIKPGIFLPIVYQEAGEHFWKMYPSDGTKAEIWVKPSGTFVQGKKAEVFVYEKDAKNQWWGSLKKPLVRPGEVAFLSLKKITPLGVFFDWGLEKDLFCPPAHVMPHSKAGLFYPVRLIPDRSGQRFIASMKWRSQLLPAGPEYAKGREVDILILEPAESGFAVLVDQQYAGMVYENQIFSSVKPGMRLKAYINKWREEDGRLDILLQKPGFAEAESAAGRLMKNLIAENGKIMLGDKSAAEDIYSHFQMSKKTFKKALGQLYKSGKIGMNDNAFWLAEDEGD